ncbi:MAG: protein kinase [Planctomycetaceae bacterium]
MTNALSSLPWLVPYLDTHSRSVSRWGALGQLWVRLTAASDDPSPATGNVAEVRSHDVPMMLFRSIGAGGMGVALLVLDPRPGDAGMRVCKVIAPPGDPIRFHEEIRLLRKIQNPHVVRCFGAAEIILPAEVGRVSPSVTLPAYFMEYVQGGSLRDLLKSQHESRSRRVPIREAFRMISQIVDALAAIHREGVIHRDLKPDNVLLDISHGRAVRICDLGIAKQQSSGNLAAPSTVPGTPCYNAPEMVANQPVGPATDYFAIGCMLVEMLTGQRVFTIASVHPYAQPYATTFQNPNEAALDTIESRYGTDTRVLIDDLLQKNPAARLSDPDEIHERIEAILGSDLKIATSYWKNDWPAHNRDAAHLSEYVGDEKSWFGSGKLSWAVCLIGLHSRRRTLSEFSQLIEELRSRLFSIATPLATAELNAGLSVEMLQVTIEEFLLNLQEANEWLRVRLTDSLRKNLSFLSQDTEAFSRFERVVTALQIEGMNHVPAGMVQAAQSTHADLAKFAGTRLHRIRTCWRICLRINDQIHDSIADCSDQLVSAVARMK